MFKDVNPLKYADNVSIMNAIRYDASLDYQKRIPMATQANMHDTVKQLMSYRPAWNEFVDALVNRIGMVILRNNSWTNPLKDFKKGLLEFGDSIEEISVGLLEAHNYDPDRDYMERALFGTELPEVQSNFHRINRQNYYAVGPIAEALLKRAFLSSTGLSDFVSQLIQSPQTSDEWDEFVAMCHLIPEYEANGGFYHVHVPDVAHMDSTEDEAKLLLRKLRAMADNLTFLSTKFNAAHMPTRISREDLVILGTPDLISGLDVMALSAAFNLDRATAHGRMIPIPADQFGVDGAQAILTTTDFFQVYDSRFEMTSQYHAIQAGTKYFLHHHQVISASRFVPAVMFWTGPDSEVITVATTIQSIAAPVIVIASDGSKPTTVDRGEMTEFSAKVTTDPADAPVAVSWSVSGASSSRTWITPTGVLHVGEDEDSAKLTITASTSFLDPDNLRADPKTASVTVDVTGAKAEVWPVQAHLTGIEVAGVPVNEPVTDATTAYTVTLPTGTTWKATDVVLSTTSGADVNVTRSGSVATATVDFGTGAPVEYTITVTTA